MLEQGGVVKDPWYIQYCFKSLSSGSNSWMPIGSIFSTFPALLMVSILSKMGFQWEFSSPLVFSVTRNYNPITPSLLSKASWNPL